MELNDIEDLCIQMDNFYSWRMRNRCSVAPNFIGVGAGRCGTTSLYDYLSKCPDVYMSPLKEINYFGIRSREYSKNGVIYQEYKNFFSGAFFNEKKIIGEISPAYFGLDHSSTEIYSRIPNAKIIITLRDPFNRFFSQFQHHANQHKYESFEKYCIDALISFKSQDKRSYVKNWFNPAKNLSDSLYFESIKRYTEKFDNVHIITFEDLVANQRNVLDSLCDFLGIQRNDIELTKMNSSKGKNNDVNSLDPEILKELKDIFQTDISLCNLPDSITSTWSTCNR